jgi:PAS domain S-box-containing protein
VASRKIESIPEYSRAALEAIASQIGLSIRQVRAEENSRQSEQEYSRAESLAHIGHWKRDLLKDSASWSPEIFRIFGINLQGGAPNFRELLNLVHPQDRDRLRDQFNSIGFSYPKKKKPVRIEFRIIRPDGMERFLSTTAQAVLSSDGQSVTLRGIVQDITERRVLEKRITAISKAERESLQRDLHDTVCQQLTGLAFLAEEIKQELFKHPEQAARDLEKIIEINQTALGQAKEVAHGLTPLTDEPGALENAIREMARYVSLTYRIPCRWIPPQRNFLLDSLTSTQLYLIAREAAVNAARHARGRLIRITLSHRGNSVTVRVTDDGRGLDPEQKRDQGLGLETMRQRADLIGARLRIFPGKKRGTVVECLWRKRIPKGGGTLHRI